MSEREREPAAPEPAMSEPPAPQPAMSEPPTPEPTTPDLATADSTPEDTSAPEPAVVVRRPAYRALSSRPAAVVTAGLDALTSAAREVRTASLYIGLLVLLLGTPIAMLIWRLTLEPFGFMPPQAEAALAVAAVIAAAGIFVATIESRAVATTLLAARLAGERLEIRAAVQRSRTVFWRLVLALLLLNVPLFLVQAFLEARTAEALGGESEPSIVLAALLTAVLFSPLAYTVTGVVLGDAGPLTAVRRSLGLFRARRLTAVIVALFDFGAQFLTAFGLLAGLEVVVGALGAAGFSGTGEVGAAVTIGLIAALLFAVGSLTFTVAAIAIAPQVTAFVALTHVAPGLDRIGGEPGRFRWLTWPMVAVIGIGSIALFGGLSAFD